MTERETMQHAKYYMDCLAQGINPVTGLECPEDSVVNQAKVIRCFFYVSGMLGKLLNNEEELPPRKKLRPFSLRMEQISMFPYKNQMGITEFVEQLENMTQDPWMKKPKTTWFTNWLMEKGFLIEGEYQSGRKHRVPTDAGYRIGMSVELRQGRYGEYQAVLYNPNAQQFLLDHLEEILPKK